MGGYWYGPGEPACQLLLNNVTPLSHFHSTHKHVHTHKHTLIPVANTNGWSLYIVVLWSSVNQAAACVSNVTRLAGKTVCVCVCVCVCARCRVKAIIMTYMKAIYNTMREAEREINTVCLCGFSHRLPASQSYKMLQYTWPTADKYTLIYLIS